MSSASGVRQAVEHSHEHDPLLGGDDGEHLGLDAAYPRPAGPHQLTALVGERDDPVTTVGRVRGATKQTARLQAVEDRDQPRLVPPVVAAGLTVAERVPTGAVRERPESPFAPALQAAGPGRREQTLALLGRDPSWTR